MVSLKVKQELSPDLSITYTSVTAEEELNAGIEISPLPLYPFIYFIRLFIRDKTVTQ